jgi:hypothetical protein
MIDNVDPKKELDEGVRSIINHLRDLEKNLVMAIQNQIDDEKLLAICLGINDDINQTFKRYEDYRSKKKPNSFLSCFLTDYAEYNLNSKRVEEPKSSSNNVNLLDLDLGSSSNNNYPNFSEIDNSGPAMDPFKQDQFNHNQFNQNQFSHNQFNQQPKNEEKPIKDINDFFDIFNK